MLRNLVAVVVGYLVAGATVLAVFAGAHALLGAEGFIRPGSYGVTPLWIVIAIAVGTAAAMLGGFVCMTIARNPKAVLALALLMVFLGAVTAAVELPRGSDQSTWMLLLNPALGFAGALLGGRLRGHRS